MIQNSLDKTCGSKTIAEFEKEKGIHGFLLDLPPQYLGVPPSAKFYSQGSVNITAMRARFNVVAKKLGLR